MILLIAFVIALGLFLYKLDEVRRKAKELKVLIEGVNK